MNGIESKGESPFSPDRPVPVELFSGRAEQIHRIMTRGVGQVAHGKPITMFLEGEYGIGKTSVARYTQWLAKRDQNFLGIYATLDRAEDLDDVGEAILEATLRTEAHDPKLGDKIREGIARFIGQQNVAGITLHFEALRKEAPNVSHGLLPFLASTLERVQSEGIRGLFLVLDEINGVCRNPLFARFLKEIVELNAPISLAKPTLPLLLMVCGVSERRGELIAHHEPVARIFDVVSIEAMSESEMQEFFNKAFAEVHITVAPEAMKTLTHYAAGFPKIMHLIGRAAYYLDRDGYLDEADASQAVREAAEEVGKIFVEKQVYQALRSADYHSIFQKIARLSPDEMSFNKAEVASGLSESEKKKFNNFLQKMKNLKVLRSGEVQGEYIFNLRMVRLYIWLQSIGSKKRAS